MIPLSIGLLMIDYHSAEGNEFSHQQSYGSHFAIRLIFIPNLDIPSVFMVAVLSKQSALGSKPRITRRVQARNVIPNTSATIACCRRNNTDGFKAFFTVGDASPYGYDQRAMTLLSVRHFTLSPVRQYN